MFLVKYISDRPRCLLYSYWLALYGLYFRNKCSYTDSLECELKIKEAIESKHYSDQIIFSSFFLFIVGWGWEGRISLLKNYQIEES